MESLNTGTPGETSSAAQPPAEPCNSVPRIKIIGVGGAGMAMLEALDPSDVQGVPCAVVLTDGVQHARCGFSEKVMLEHRRLRGLGAGSDPERARALAEEQYAVLQSIVAGTDVVILVAGFGGGSGTGITPVLAKAAKDGGAMVFVFATLPFSCERRRAQLAAEGISAAREIADGVICLPNEKVLSLIDEKTSCQDAFALTRRLIAQGVRGLYQWLVYRGPMEVPFEEVCRLLQDQHTECAFATAEASGPGRARAAVDQLLASPLLDHGALLSDAQSVLISLLGGTELPMAEVQQVIKEIGAHCENAEVVAGTAEAEHMKDRLAVTVLVTRRTPVHTEVDVRGAVPVPEPEVSRVSLPNLGNVRRASFDVSSAPGEGAPEAASRTKKGASKLRQAQLALPLVSRGQRFENSEPTMHKGEDLDIPTYIRRGILLN